MGTFEKVAIGVTVLILVVSLVMYFNLSTDFGHGHSHAQDNSAIKQTDDSFPIKHKSID